MPELPEVETVKRGMEEVLLGDVIEQVDQRRPDLRVPFPEGLKEKLSGRSIDSMTRRAKYILIHLDNGLILVLHLGMSGRVLVLPDGNGYEPVKHDHLILSFQSGAALVLNDPRRFGMVLLLMADELKDHASFKNMGPEPLGNEFSGTILFEKLKGKKTSIKAALLDQRLVAGLGNIYVCEALFYAAIAPVREAMSLTGDETEKLVVAIRSVLNKAIEAGGSSLKDYRTAGGDLGYFQFSFAVYDREGMACPRCDCDVSKTKGVKRIIQGGRSTFYCPEKQV